MQFALLPMQLLAVIARKRSWDGLTTLRLKYIGFVVYMLAMVPILIGLDLRRSEDALSTDAAHGIVLAASVGLYGLMIGTLQRRRQAGTPQEAAIMYSSRFFLKIALSIGAALVGFVLVFYTGKLSPFYLGLVLAVPGFVFAAPTRDSVARFHRDLAGHIDLVDALMTMPPPGSAKAPRR